MHIIITGHVFGFPNGYGASSRICNYALGLSALGAKVRVLCLKASELPGNNSLNHEASGEYHGVPFQYTTGQSVAAGSRLGSWRLNLRGLARARQALRRARRTAPVDAVMLYGTESLLYSVILRLCAWEVGARLVGEETEEPFLDVRPGWGRDLRRFIHNHFTLRLFDGFVVISRHLELRIQPFLSRRSPILRLPVLVDTERFATAGSGVQPQPGTVAYCGDLAHLQEVLCMLQAWVLIARVLPAARLRIIGGLFDPRIRGELKSQVAALGIETSVELAGALPRAELPQKLAEASVMALPRAAGLFSQAGMPNKLGEYLATGRPVVVTKTGDLGSYLEDKGSAYLVPPGDTVAFAEALRQALTYPEEAAKVGRRGQAVALEHLDMRRNCTRLLDFVRGIGK